MTSYLHLNTLNNLSMNSYIKNISKAIFVALVLLISNSSAQWTKTPGPSGNFIFSLAVSGTNIFAGTDEGVFRSTDNGSSWTGINNGLTNSFGVYSLIVSGNNIFA